MFLRLFWCCLALSAAGCGNRAISVEQMWSVQGLVRDKQQGGELPIVILPGSGLLTELYDDQKRIAVFRVRSLSTGGVMAQFAQDGPAPWAADPSGRYVALPGTEKEGILGLWDVKTGKRAAVLLQHLKNGDSINSLAVSSGGKLVLVGTGSGDVLLYRIDPQASHGPIAPSVLGHTGETTLVILSPDGDRALAAFGLDYEKAGVSWTIWDTGTGNELARVHGKKGLSPSAAKAKWKGFYNYTLFDWETGDAFCRLDQNAAPRYGYLRDMRLLPDDRGILAYFQAAGITFFKDHALCLYDLSGKLISTKAISSSMIPLSFGSDGRQMATVDLAPGLPAFLNFRIRLWRIIIDQNTGTVMR
jgi:WD40 repeat protein